jgi:hypothetical protein
MKPLGNKRLRLNCLSYRGNLLPPLQESNLLRSVARATAALPDVSAAYATNGTRFAAREKFAGEQAHTVRLEAFHDGYLVVRDYAPVPVIPFLVGASGRRDD